MRHTGTVTPAAPDLMQNNVALCYKFMMDLRSTVFLKCTLKLSSSHEQLLDNFPCESFVGK